MNPNAHLRLALSASALVLAACSTTEPRSDENADVSQALATITAGDFAAKLGALAHDSTLGRLAPGPELIKATTWVVNQLQDAGVNPVRQMVLVNASPVDNVIGTLPGSDSAHADEVVLVSSHVDHIGTVGHGLGCGTSIVLPSDSICNGADDNASGTVGVIEVARAMVALHQRPARTIVFAVFTGEEEGLVGSQWYVSHPTVPLANIVAVVNLDMLARHPAGTANVGGLSLSSLGDVVQSLAAAHAELALTPADFTSAWAQSDHYPFAMAGIPAIFFCSGFHADLHTTADNPDRANSEQASRIAKLAFLTALDVANARGRPTWK